MVSNKAKFINTRITLFALHVSCRNFEVCNIRYNQRKDFTVPSRSASGVPAQY